MTKLRPEAGSRWSIRRRRRITRACAASSPRRYRHAFPGCCRDAWPEYRTRRPPACSGPGVKPSRRSRAGVTPRAVTPTTIPRDSRGAAMAVCATRRWRHPHRRAVPPPPLGQALADSGRRGDGRELRRADLLPSAPHRRHLAAQRARKPTLQPPAANDAPGFRQEADAVDRLR